MSDASPAAGGEDVRVPGPPWILGEGGAPLEAPENTLAGLRRALALGLDGVQYDVRACASGDPVLLRDATLERTTDGRGLVEHYDLPRLFQLDAGGWFDRRFVGEPVPVLDEALECGPETPAEPDAGPTMHRIELHDAELVGELARRVRQLGARLSVRVATRRRDLCLELRDAGLVPLLVADVADRELRAFVRDERLPAVCLPLAAWCSAPGREEWPCERWSRGLDDPHELLAACRLPLFAFGTSEPQRALAVRALAHLTRGSGAPYPLELPQLPVTPSGEEGAGGEWSGRWALELRVHNPFAFRVGAAAQLFVRRGAFEVEGLPARLELGPGASASLDVRLAGGSWSPGGDPLVAVVLRWRAGPGRPAGRLLLDAPLRRVRRAVADPITRRLELLRESPGQPAATMTLRRRGGELLVAIENPGGLRNPRTVVHLAGRTLVGGQGLRLTLPEGFDQRADGVPFSCGILGEAGEAGEAERGAVLRRFAGGLPEGPQSGAPGVLLPVGQG